MGAERTLGLLELKDNIFEIAIEHTRQVGAAVANTVVSHAVLWEVVGADFFGAIARADQVAALGALFSLFCFNLHSEQARAEYVHGLFFVFNLGLFVLTRHNNAGWQVGDAYSRVS